MKISLLTGGDDPNYAFPLASSLASKGIVIDFIGNDRMQRPEITSIENVNYLNLRGDQSENVPRRKKICRVLKYYGRLVKYTAKTDTALFHILWLNKFVHFDRTLLMLYYKISGKRIVFTAHNVNAAERDGNDNLLNRITLRFMYTTVDHIIVHTEKMKQQLIDDFNVTADKVTVIPFGMNTFIPVTMLTEEQAKKKLNLKSNEKNLLFFGRITPYKGLEHLVSAVAYLKEKGCEFKLIIAGKVEKKYESYWKKIDESIKVNHLQDYIIKRIEFIPEEDIEIYFKAADVLILPYKHIFQSGPLFTSYNFGLPVIATDVGSFKEDIVEGETGFICKPGDPEDLAEKMELYFNSDLYMNLEANRRKIMEFAQERYSWERNGETIYSIYRNLLARI